MVTNLTNYGKQIRFMLTTDDPTAVEWQNGDLVFLMDLDKLYVFDADNSTFKEISTGGGGGGGGGGSGYHLIGSGSYTLASDTAESFTIPISVNGTPKEAFLTTPSPIPDISQATEIVYFVTEGAVQDALGNLVCSGRGFSAGGAYVAPTKPAGDHPYITQTEFKVVKITNTYRWKANTYNWYVWGV